jgi:hypothetical protein
MSKAQQDLSKKLQTAFQWSCLNKDWIQIQMIDAHPDGEPLRILFGGTGLTTVAGPHILDRRRQAQEH